jgi:hypothetical protein
MDSLGILLCFSTPAFIFVVLCIRDYMDSMKELLPITVTESVAVSVINDAYQLQPPIHRRRGSPKSVV